MTEVRLSLIGGKLDGAEWVFKGPSDFTIGRGDDCELKTPLSDDCWMISRRHCRVEIDPSVVRVQDLGSRNGTFINGENIGQRKRGEPAEDAVLHPGPKRKLMNGDLLLIGNTLFRVKILNAAPRREWLADICRLFQQQKNDPSHCSRC